MKCGCFNKIDDKLREKNLKLSAFAFRMPDFSVTPIIATVWLDAAKAPRDQKRNPPPMFASHCPFCGQPIDGANVSDELRADAGQQTKKARTT